MPPTTSAPTDRGNNEPPVEAPEYTPNDASFAARMQWPYLTQPGGMLATNGRELGCWIAGHLQGRALHGEVGARVEVPEAFLAGVSAVLLAAGFIVQHYSSPDASGFLNIDVWLY